MEYKFEKERGVFKLYKGETGKDWSNHLFNGLSYVTSITHYGVPWSRYIDENSVQVTLNCPLTSFVYIRDGRTKNYWNIAGYPSLKKIKKYCCEHGQEYTKISSEYLGIEGSVTYSIAKDDTREVWKVTLRNRTERSGDGVRFEWIRPAGVLQCGDDERDGIRRRGERNL